MGNEATIATDPSGLSSSKKGGGNTTIAEVVPKLSAKKSCWWLIVAVNNNENMQFGGGITGHSWIGIADLAAGSVTVAGLHPTKQVTNLTPEVPGAILNDSGAKFHVARAYPLNKKQYQLLAGIIKADTATPPTYDVISNNCTTWDVDRIMKAVGRGQGVKKVLLNFGGTAEAAYTPKTLREYLESDASGILFQ